MAGRGVVGRLKPLHAAQQKKAGVSASAERFPTRRQTPTCPPPSLLTCAAWYRESVCQGNRPKKLFTHREKRERGRETKRDKEIGRERRRASLLEIKSPSSSSWGFSGSHHRLLSPILVAIFTGHTQQALRGSQPDGICRDSQSRGTLPRPGDTQPCCTSPWTRFPCTCRRGKRSRKMASGRPLDWGRVIASEVERRLQPVFVL